jgi:leucyl aminopeptidase
MSVLRVEDDGSALPLWLVAEGEPDAWAPRLPAALRARAAAWALAQGYRGERGRVLALPAADGALEGAVLGLGRDGAAAAPGPDALRPAADRLPVGPWRLAEPLAPEAATQAALGFALGAYRYERYRRPGPVLPTLLVPAGADRARLERLVAADRLARDLINTPAEDLGPAELGAAVAAVAGRHGANCQEIVGAALAAGFPAVHAVGRAAARAPRLLELRHGAAGPRVTLVGKGVCFDSGGLDLKPASGMLLMKKDMGGAACALAVAELVMAAGIEVRLRLLIPAVENSVAGNAFRPGDVIRTRKGITVEVGNTDAEGRLLLADALAYADEERPDLLVDLATLTGAARVALGPELPALFTPDEALGAELLAAARTAADPVWRLPLHAGYDDEFGSKVADIGNVSAGGFAGAVIAALFLARFVGATTHWLHLDLYAWNNRERPGRPVGAEAQTVRALEALLRARYAPR